MHLPPPEPPVPPEAAVLGVLLFVKRMCGLRLLQQYSIAASSWDSSSGTGPAAGKGAGSRGAAGRPPRPPRARQEGHTHGRTRQHGIRRGIMTDEVSTPSFGFNIAGMTHTNDSELAALEEALTRATSKYRIEKALSRGAFGFVVKGRHQDGQEVAMKFIRIGPAEDTKEVLREIMHHQKLLHAHVVRFKEAFAAPPYLCICMEFVPGGDLLDYINSRGGVPEDEARYIFQQLILAVDYCHRVGVMNRDIKPENTLLVRVPLKPPMVKLCDFGYAKSLEDSAPATRAGTFHYVAPEVMLNVRPHHYDGMKADIWSCGVLLYVMLFCTFPFLPEDSSGSEAQQMHRVLRRMAKGEFTFPARRPVSEACKDLIEHMLNPEHTERYTVEDVKRHPWFLTNLLPGTLEYNDKVLSIPRIMPQSESDIQDMIEKARAGSRQASQSTSGAYNSFNFESDEDDDMQGLA